MEKTIVQFILDNLWVFVPIGAAGIIVTIVLFFLPKKVTSEVSEDLSTDFISILKLRVNVYLVVYLFLFIGIFIIGLLSDFLVPSIVGGVIAAIPFLILTILEFNTKKSKVS